MRRTLFQEEHEAFRDSIRTFAAREVVPHQARWRECRVGRELWLAAGRADFLGISIPGVYGGGETNDFPYNVVLTEELARLSLALSSSVGIHTDVVAPYLVELTSEEQKQRWLPGFCTSTLVSAIGMTEPSGARPGEPPHPRTARGRRLAAHRLKDVHHQRHERRSRGDSGAYRAGAPRHQPVLCGGRTEGFSRGRQLHKIGQPEADTSELFFEDVLLGQEHVLGELNRGFTAMMSRLPQERLHSACANVAHAREALVQTLSYAGERSAFGRPIGTFQHHRFLLAEIVTELDVAQAYADQCVQRYVDGTLEDVDTARAKWWSAQVQNRVIDACVQLHGGYGYMDEYPVARAWVDARVTKIWAGSNEIMKEVIGRLLGFGEVRS